MAVIPDNPTWAQIQAGLIAAGNAKQLANTQVNDANVIIRAQTTAKKVAQQNVARADADLGQWLAAAKRKAES